MSNQSIVELLEECKNKKLTIFLKNGFRYEGVLVWTDESFLKLMQPNDELIFISLSSVENIKLRENGK